MDIAYLSDQIALAAPINGVSVGSQADKATWRIDFQVAATSGQRLAAQAVVDGWDIGNSPSPSTPSLIAMGQMILADGDVSSVTISAALAGAFMFDVGEFWVFFLLEQPDANYMALAYDGGSVRAFVQDDEKATDHFVIRTTDFTGTPTNPPALNFEIKRVI